MADGGGFEPPVPCGTHAFQACTIDRSVTHPSGKIDNLSRVSLSATAALQDLNLLAQFRDVVVWQNAAEIYVWINKTIAPDDRAGINHRVATNLSPVADNRTKLFKSRSNVSLFRRNRDLAVIEFHVRQDHACAEVRFESENRIADVIEMRHLRFVEDDAVFEFARVAHDHAVADHDILAHITAASDMAVVADPRRPF